MTREHRPSERDVARPAKRPGTTGPRPPSSNEAVLALQATAGNRATRDAVAALQVQRATSTDQAVRGSEGAGGQLTLEGFATLPITSATWSQAQKVAQDQSGHGRAAELHPTGTQPSAIVVTLAGPPDRALLEAVARGPTIATGTLRLDRRSKDGALPATSIDLRDIVISSVSTTGGDKPVTTITLSVAGLSGEGLGADAGAANAIGSVDFGGAGGGAGGKPWPAMPVIAWTRTPTRTAIVGPAGGMSGPSTRPEPIHVKATIAAGPSVKSLFEAMGGGRVLQLTFTSKQGRVHELRDAIVELISSSTAGPDIVELGFVAAGEKFRQ